MTKDETTAEEKSSLTKQNNSFMQRIVATKFFHPSFITLSFKAVKRSWVFLFLFSLLWFTLEWEIAGPRPFRETTNDRSSSSTLLLLTTNTREKIGSWQGNTWIPPDGWDYFSVTRMQQFYAQHTLLWLGDSTSRRAALTWHSLLRTPNPQDASLWSLESPGVIDVTARYDDFECSLNATHRPRICRLDDSAFPFLQVRENCWTHVVQFLQDETRNPEITIMSSHPVDLVVVGAGIWDIDVSETCRLEDPRPLSVILQEVIFYLDQMATAKRRVVVRTCAYSDWGQERAIQVDEMNEIIMDSIDQMKNPFLTYIHWGGAMKPRALSPYRIVGDNKAHFGVEGRLVLIHMLTNHLLDVGFFSLKS